MKSKILVCIIIFAAVFIVAGESVLSRPVYSFSDDVFSMLPVFPDDFYDIKSLYTSSRINATRLDDSYLQPEMLPNWMFFANKTYYDNVQMGSYGIFCYPSHLSIGNISSGDSFVLSTLIYALWGIHFYQGTNIIFNHSSDVNVTLLEPSSPVMLFSPTYPRFLPGWMQVLCFRVDIGVEGEHFVDVFNSKPSSIVNDEFKSLYGDKYVSGMGLLSLSTPCLRVDIYPPIRDERGSIPISYYIGVFFIFFIIGFIYAVVRYNARLYNKEE